MNKTIWFCIKINKEKNKEKLKFTILPQVLTLLLVGSDKGIQKRTIWWPKLLVNLNQKIFSFLYSEILLKYH